MIELDPAIQGNKVFITFMKGLIEVATIQPDRVYEIGLQLELYEQIIQSSLSEENKGRMLGPVEGSA